MFQRILLFLSLFIFSVAAEAKEIVIYHTTDIYGSFAGQTDEEGNQYGGFARLAALIKETKQPYLLLDSGDFNSNQAVFSEGAYTIDLMNKVGYNAITLGNHDAAFNSEGLADVLSNFHGDILAMNVTGINMPKKQIKENNIYKVGGIKVGVIGVARGDSDSDVKINTPSTADFEEQIQTLKGNGAEVIIILAHDSMLNKENIPENKKSNILQSIINTASFGELSLMLGGHALTPVLVGRLTNKDTKGPWILESAPYLQSVTKIVIDKDKKTGKISVKEPQFIKLNGKEDKKIKRYVDLIVGVQKATENTEEETVTEQEIPANTSDATAVTPAPVGNKVKPEQKNKKQK